MILDFNVDKFKIILGLSSNFGIYFFPFNFLDGFAGPVQ